VLGEQDLGESARVLVPFSVARAASSVRECFGSGIGSSSPSRANALSRMRCAEPAPLMADTGERRAP